MSGFEVVIEAVDNASPQLEKLSNELIKTAKRSAEAAQVISESSAKTDSAISSLPQKIETTAKTMSLAQEAAKQLVNQLAGIASIAGMTAFFKSAALAAMEEENALKRLEFAVEATGGSFEREKEKIISFANEQQSLTKFSDTQTYDALGKLVRVTGDVAQAMSAVKLAFGMASASGKDLNYVLELLAPVLNGDATRLRSLKNEFGSFIDNADSAQEVIDALSRKFSGAAESENTFSKEINMLKNRLGDFKEVVGVGVIPVFKLLLEGALKGAQFFEILGVTIANMSAKAVIYIESLAEKAVAVFKAQFVQLPVISEQTSAKLKAIEEATTEHFIEIHKRYSTEEKKLTESQVELKARATQKTIEQSEREAEERKKQMYDAHVRLVQLDAQRLESEGNTLEARLKLIELEKQQRISSFEEMRSKGLITEDELTTARQNASAIAIAESQKVRDSLNADLLMVQNTNKAVSEAFASSFSGAIADMILQGKSFEEAWKSVMNTVLRTAIETFTKIAIERAIAESSITGGLSALAPVGLLAGFTSIMSPISKGLGKIFGFQEGGIVKEPVLATIGEKGPEAVIPLSKLEQFKNDVNVNIIQHNNINISNSGDVSVKELMRKISEVTRSGASEGAELVKSILSKQTKLSRESV